MQPGWLHLAFLNKGGDSPVTTHLCRLWLPSKFQLYPCSRESCESWQGF